MKARIVLSLLCASLGLSPSLAGQPNPTVTPTNLASAVPQPDAKTFEVVSRVWATPFKPQGKTATCWSFSTTSFLESEANRLPLNDYVEITSYSQLPFYGAGELLIPDNWMHQPYCNVPLDDFMRIFDHALANGFSLVCSLHATDEEFRSRCNYLLAFDEGADTHTTQDQRDTMFESWRVEDVHAVHVVGLAKDESGKRFYLTKDTGTPLSEENSDYYNKDYLSVEFVRARVLLVMVHKDGIPADIRTRLGLGGN